ncbi:MAG: TonB-dependent receptor [Amphiplicatus sp.]
MSFKDSWRCGAALAAFVVLPATADEGDVRQDEIIVTASPMGRTVEETIIGTSVISHEDLQQRLESSIGETLRREPGISSTFFGPGASRPVIRGLGGDRISVLDSGIGSIDASATSPDHAAAIEPAMAEKIEIVRGAATLLYGSSAAGGVVNVFGGRIPRALPEGGIDGALRVGKSTVDEGTEAAGGFSVQLGGGESRGFVFHGEGGYRRAEDYDIPGFAHSERLRDVEATSPEGPDLSADKLANTALRSHNGTAGLSYVFEGGFAGLSASALDSFYGIPGSDEASPDGTGPHIDLRQRRIDFDSEANRDFLLFKTMRLRFGYADYAHTEIEPSGEPGTVFSNEGYEGRLEFVDRTVDLGEGRLNGAVGFQFKSRDFSAVGEESFVPETKSRQYGLFALKEYSQGPWRLEAGGRYERTSYMVPSTSDERGFDAWSVSVGIGFAPADGVFFGVTGLRTERAPALEELFANGPHLATGTFEVGAPDLGKETARGVEATAKLGGEQIAFTVNGFYTSYKDFIFEENAGMTADLDGEEIPIFQFAASDATFKGFETQLEAELFHAGMFDVHADASVDYVRATAAGSGTGDLPRIPPLKGLFGLEMRSDRVDLRGEVEHANDQNRVGDDELATEGYTAFNAFVTLRPFEAAQGLAVRLAALNLSDEEMRLHTSFLKDVAPLPGRNFRISLTGTF